MKPAGIKGVEGTVPVGAVLTVGHKGPSGAPTDTDRFFIVVPQMADGRRDLHPAFAKFNDAAPELRQSIQGNLVHATQAECFEHHLKAQVLPRLVHPMKAPVCTGDGSRAQRWDARAQAFMEIPCPNELCEFRQGQVKACKPWLRLLFQPRWKGGSLPTPLMKLTSASWNNTRAFLGFFEYVQSQATQLGLPELNLYGLPFVLTLSRKTIPTQKRAFPVLSISPDCNLQEYLLLHAQRRAQLTQAPRFVALTDRSQQAPQELLADHSTITPGLPGEVLP